MLSANDEKTLGFHLDLYARYMESVKVSFIILIYFYKQSCFMFFSWIKITSHIIINFCFLVFFSDNSNNNAIYFHPYTHTYIHT